MKKQPRKQSKSIPRILLVGIIIASCLITFVVWLLLFKNQGPESDVRRSTFTVSGAAGNVGGACQTAIVDTVQYCIEPGKINVPMSGQYKIDASYRTGKKSFTNSANPPQTEVLPTIFIQEVYSVTPANSR